MARLSEDAIQEELAGLDGWERQDKAIRRTFTFGSFPEAIAFVVRVGFAAESADHHPDVHIDYKRVTLTYWTHSEGGLTAKDFKAAHAADAISR